VTIKPILLLTCLAVVLGCASDSNAMTYHPTPTSDAFSPKTEMHFTNLLQRASFELSCDAQQLSIKNLPNKPLIMTDLAYGVEGCGKRALYKLVLAGGIGWVLESTVQELAPATEPTAPSEPTPETATETETETEP
jgi:hypothetical protein